MTQAQYPLEFGHRAALGRADFVVAPCNAQAVQWLDRWPDWGFPGLVLAGPQGAGKSHLLAAFASKHGGRLVDARTLTLDRLPQLVQPNRLVLVDDVTEQADQALLFHLFNLVVQGAASMVFATPAPPAQMRFTLPDWSSRLATLPVAEIDQPDDDLLGAVLVKLFSDRQVIVGPDLVRYLLGRIERSFAAAGAVVAALDRAALVKGSAITVPLARKILDGSEP